MSFNNSARRALDTSLPLNVRVQSLHSCIGEFSPFGFADTRSRLRSMLNVSDTGWTAEQVVQAGDLLLDARRSWLTALAEHRQVWKDAERLGHRPPGLPRRVDFHEWLSTFLTTEQGSPWSRPL
ncbi:hypothetical protein [Cellulomonas sp. NS3]|uniref:hypothetical protein n=1 Tax=Cellulomonas sp. NS3 TaxID=2973977 RepID=UPI002162D636|nr:hypothetical protein [Cellulomonas sp. NS3]